MTADTNPGPVRVIPTLPAELDGRAITWDPWELAPIMTHLDNGCEVCDHEGPMSIALGHTGGPAYHATRCRRCQTTTVITRQPGYVKVKPGTNTPIPSPMVVAWQYQGTTVGPDL